ncbi:MAG: GTPase Era [Byssovorax sp.]
MNKPHAPERRKKKPPARARAGAKAESGPKKPAPAGERTRRGPGDRASTERKGPGDRASAERRGPGDRASAERKGPADRASAERKGRKDPARPGQRPAAKTVHAYLPAPAKGGSPGKKKRAPAAPGDHPRAGRVALIGRPNVGKSTLLNAALEQPLTIVSPTPQTTRDSILGVVHHRDAEIALLDTPGLHRPRTELGRVMNQTAREAARTADVIVFVTDLPRPRREARGKDGEARAGDAAARPLAPHPGDLTLLADIGEGTPTVLVINKVDRLADKGRLFPLIEAFSRVRSFAAVVPISALRTSGIERVLDEVRALLPEAPWSFDIDDITDRPIRFFAAEYVREQILRATEAEVPHAVAVAIERFVEPPGEGGTLHVDATIWVERPGQKRILIGRGGEMLKAIGTRARLRLEALAGRKVNLKLWVRVTPDWRESRAELGELGYSAAASGERAGHAAPAMIIHAELPAEGEDEDISGRLPNHARKQAAPGNEDPGHEGGEADPDDEDEDYDLDEEGDYDLDDEDEEDEDGEPSDEDDQ